VSNQDEASNIVEWLSQRSLGQSPSVKTACSCAYRPL